MRRDRGTGLLGPAERSERRYLRNFDDPTDDLVDAGSGGRSGGGGEQVGGGLRGEGGGGGQNQDNIGADHGIGGKDDVVDIDQTIDRYDYLIAFPNPPEFGARRGRAGSDEEENSGELSSRRSDYYSELEGAQGGDGHDSHPYERDTRRITLAEVGGEKLRVNEIWYSAVPGDEISKTAAKESLAREFQDRFRAPTNDSEEVTISRSEWVRLARDVIIKTLFAKSGLQLKLTLSRQRDRVLCRIRAPIILLEREAAREKYRLQFRGEVDPGDDFWTEDEIAEEQSLFGKDEANETLEKLFQAEKISPNDLTIFDEEVVPNQWNRRVHALERIADRVPVTNRFPAFAEFSNEDKHRHLFQTYPSIRGRTIFRAKDRLALTKSIISGFFDMGVLEARGVVDATCALHDANRGESVTTEVLQKRWTLGFCRESNDRIGAPMVSMAIMDDGYRVPWFLKLFCQPLDDVRDYFGEKLAFYFAWLGFYGWALVIPAFYGIAVEIYLLYAGTTFEQEGLNYAQVSMAVAVVLWGTIYQELWAREEKVVAVKWGTSGFEEVEKDRPHFEGDKDSPNGGKRRSPVTHTFETHFPSHKRKVRQALGLVVVLLFVVALLALVWMVEWLEHYLEDDLGYSWGGTATSVLSSVQIQILSFVYSRVVKKLNDFENYRTETAYENNLIFKTFLFQMLNNYAALCYTAFIESETYGCSTSCVQEVRELLVFIFGVRFIMVGMEVFIPMATARIMSNVRKEKGPGGKGASFEGRRRASSAPVVGSRLGEAMLDEGEGLDADEEPFEAELRLPEYDGTFSDFSAIVLQYGFVTMFVSALPAITFFAMVEVMLQIRTDSFKLVSLMRRPDPEMAEGVGMWSTLMDAMGFLAVLTNTAIICFTGGNLHSATTETKFVTWLVFEHALLLLKVIVHVIIPDEAESLTLIKARQRFIVHKHLLGFVRDDDRQGVLSGESQRRGHLDIVGLEFDSEQLGRQLPPAAMAQLGHLRAELRDVTRRLKVVKEQLQGACQYETFNDQTGIGETKHGLPLGCLNIKLIRLDGMEGDPQATTVVMSLRNSRQGDKTPPGPSIQASRPAERGSPGASGGSSSARGVMIFSQVFVMAPIRSQDLEIVFDVTQKLGNTNRGYISLARSSKAGKVGTSADRGGSRRVGTCRVSLRELADQREHDIPLNVLTKAENRWVPSPARLYVKLKFMFSKIVPLRNRIYALQGSKRSIEKEITLLQIGGGQDEPTP